MHFENVRQGPPAVPLIAESTIGQGGSNGQNYKYSQIGYYGKVVWNQILYIFPIITLVKMLIVWSLSRIFFLPSNSLTTAKLAIFLQELLWKKIAKFDFKQLFHNIHCKNIASFGRY